MDDQSHLYPLEISDEYGLQGLKDRQDLLDWLDSWLKDSDSLECRIEKLPKFTPNNYIKP